ncbi:hypothetical protein BV372_25135 [Nostoc sp. T09]|uniref:hypothetical protein n=1 Tax=Nostoc sp. T09 TaxID=1932621 RepID=UPI000A3BDBE2|nr:hypothetical protein [Nostoc sp. T09]OUL28353.1 hypothetical protein BV372_25135 [Nostoc sp. T09]
MRLSLEKVIVPVGVALIGLVGALGAAWINVNPNNKPEIKPSTLQCNLNIASKICVANLTVQINSDEPLQVINHQRIPLKTGDNLKVLNLSYCIPSEVSLNKLEAKAYLFKNGVETYKDVLSTPSHFAIHAGVCHKMGNFQTSWKLEPGQHQAMIPIIKYDGSNRIVDKSFYFTLDVGS